jgi:uncharacterized protein
MVEHTIHVEVAYATPDRQWLIGLDAPAGTTAGEAIRLSGLLEELPGLDTASVGIFGEHVEPGRELEDGDRVEIYRPLIADPREERRAAARSGRTMKRRR